MNKLIAVTAVVALLLTMAVSAPVVANTTLHVDDDLAQWPSAYTSITDALVYANVGDAIIVHEGTYNESVQVSVAGLTIQGRGWGEQAAC